MKTRDRILEVSLALFNDQGEPNVTTNHIADEMEISPGNLYYHFRNKDQIVQELFDRFERRIDEVLVAPEDRVPDMEDMWFLLHMVFETIWDFRFIYRDLVDLLARSRRLRVHFGRITERKIDVARRICRGLREVDTMQASDAEIDALASNVALVATFWLGFHSVRQGRLETAAQALPAGIYQVLSLVAGFLAPAPRAHLERLAREYL